MALKPIDIQRLEKLKGDIERLQLRFPITTIAQRMGIHKGTVSSFLSGRIPVSDNYLNKFYIAFSSALKEAPEATPSQTELDLFKSIDNRLLEVATVLTDIKNIISTFGSNKG
jgi:hypothetical protein